MSSSDFDKIDLALTEKYEAVVKTALEQSTITDLKDFYNVYHDEKKAIDEECVTPTKKTPKLENFAEVFKLLDVHPPNLQKSKPKAPPMRERANSTISRSSTSSLNDLSSSSSQKDSSTSSLNLVTKYEEPPTIKPSDTYKNYITFQKQLKQVQLELEQQSVEKGYETKLKQLGHFSQQLEKLLPSDKVGQAALTLEEEKILSELVEKMDDLNFIRTNHGLFCQENNPIFNNSQRLENVIDILSHCLIAANSFNVNM
ncbi:augmin complex subunit msd5 [Musca vetustissima]|uniref:augmin complex subunit msd5 n=1 Tax=Musca vetustissima TaxID=27455 RepID=UPI002AB6A983|nr:augmin complex subunit msd5 [Musca vetustissima]